MNASTLTLVAIISTLFVSYAGPLSAQAGDSTLPASVLACADENDVMLRLSCYDREVAAYRNKPSALPPAASDAPTAIAAAGGPAGFETASAPAVVAAESLPTESVATPARSANSVDNFGFDAPDNEITSNVTRIRERPYGELIVYLENGQIWEQKHLDRRFRLKPGESVTISKSPVAGYRMSGNSNRSIQVERLK